ncbi:hypothetical protein [Pedobacter cryoconitis]|nr:hypothetical protein [Pedobacter cryoconitis]
MRRNTICLLNINMQDLTILFLDLKVRVRTGGWSNFFTSVFPITED